MLHQKWLPSNVNYLSIMQSAKCYCQKGKLILIFFPLSYPPSTLYCAPFHSRTNREK